MLQQRFQGGFHKAFTARKGLLKPEWQNCVYRGFTSKIGKTEKALAKG